MCLCFCHRCAMSIKLLFSSSSQGRTANRSTAARLDIRATSFWTRQQDAFFDVRVTNPKAHLHSASEVQHHLLSHEQQKKCQYGLRVTTIDRGSFTPLVFAKNGIWSARSANDSWKRWLDEWWRRMETSVIQWWWTIFVKNWRCPSADGILR